MTILEELYNEYINGNEEYYKIYKTGEAADSLEELEQLMEGKLKDTRLRMDISDSVGVVVYTHEKQGFTLGFRYAMRLAAEVFTKAGREV